jgi:hypothetical protein
MSDPFDVLRTELVNAAARAHPESASSPRRRWRWSRRRPLAVVLAALVICGSAAAGVLSLTASPSQPLAGRLPGSAPGRLPGSAPGGGPRTVAGFRYTITVTPELSAGAPGWITSLAYSNPRTGATGGESGGGGYPTASVPIFQGSSVDMSEPVLRGDRVAFVVTGPHVAAVRIGSRTIRTFSAATLPTGDRAAVFFLPAGAPQPMLGERAGSPSYIFYPGPGHHKPVAVIGIAALDASGKTIPPGLPVANQAFGSFWQAPSAVTPNISEPRYRGRTRPARGICQLGQRGLPGLHAEWGTTIRRLASTRDALGELFESCVSSEYYLRGRPLAVGLLLDARRPGQALDSLPGARPVFGNPDLVDYESGGFSAKRLGNAWLVVKGADEALRLEVLRALRVTRLDLAPRAP